MRNAHYFFATTPCLCEDLQTAPADLFSGGQGMTGYTGQLSGGSWSAIFLQAIVMNEIPPPPKEKNLNLKAIVD